MALDLDKQVCSFIQTTIGLSSPVQPEQTIFGDLSVDGEDAQSLLASFADHFGVDMSGFHFATYFGPEMSATPFSLRAIARRLFGLSAENSVSLMPLRVADLISAAKRKQW